MDKQSKYLYTSSLFNESLIKLLGVKEINQITVKELCDKAGVHRSTFYIHYDNIYDVLEETIENIDKKFRSKFKGKSISKEMSNGTLNKLIFINNEYLMPYLEFVKENKNMYLIKYKNPKLLNAIEEKNSLYKDIINPILLKFNVPKDEIKYYRTFYVSGVLAIIMEWVQDDCKESTEKICEMIIKCVKSNYE